MRITNRMMTNNMLYNINGNKNTLAVLEQQYATGAKIQKPSEDPIVAVRALKLRTNLSELTQYYKKNIPDAKAWMDVTESALTVVNDILTQVHTYCVQGATGTIKEGDRDDIIKTLTQLKQQVYQEGDTNYAGRYVFTGYKTDTSLIFDEPQEHEKYAITENFTAGSIDTIKKTLNDCDMELYDPDDPSAAEFEDKPNMHTAYRIRLSYDKLDSPEDDGNIVIRTAELDEDGEVVRDEDGNIIYDESSEVIESMLSTDPNAYLVEDGIRYLTDTGELILSPEVYEEWRHLGAIQVDYEKTNFAKNDLRPEHYFDCTVTDLTDEDKEPVVYTRENQQIGYEVNFKQRLTINTQGADAIQHDIGRTIDEMVNAVNEVMISQAKLDELDKMIEDDNTTPEQKKKLEEMRELVNTEYVLKTEALQSAFSNALTKIENQQDVVNVAVSDLGARYVRLQLTESRLGSEKTEFEELLSSNEDVDMVDTIIRYRSMQAIYNASLSAASQSVQTTLLDFL
ncbi:MAG: flagellar hook-associated protein FlgL [Lachnospiraceae bacterium]|jgi:flagellar hook-associated protein 3 FlgL|nr:flagellar hook-associated protein FlgL [Lachnospiraceae bacterium]MCX4345872.1 flagellar hook-associated protein FlgL [Lachnospiraceae bacterium]